MRLPFRPLPLCVALSTLFPLLAISAEATDAPAAAEETPADLGQVTIFGRGQSRQVHQLGTTELAESAPGSSPLKALATLPGVNFQSADALGASEWSTKLTLRGFQQNQLGFTLDDVPLGDMSYRNHNGLHISRAVISEDLRRVVLSQGTGALDTASTSNLGGTVQFYSLDPSDERRVQVAQTLGERSNRRTYLRVDTGRLGPGTTLALSYADQSADKWKGAGKQEQRQFNGKLVHEAGDHRVSAFVNWSSRKEIDYQDLSKEMIGRLGTNWDNYYPDWNAALASANGTWTRGETSVDDAYYAGSGLREDWLGGVTHQWRLNDALALKTTVYHHQDKGPSLWYSPYRASSATVPVSLRTVEYRIQRSGALSSVNWQAGLHDVNAGVWYESNRFDQAMRFYNEGSVPSSPYDTPSNPALTRWSYRFKTNTVQLHLQDTLRLTPDLKVNAGFKTLHSRTAVGTLEGDEKAGDIATRKNFLPQAGANLRLDARHEVFASVAQNVRAFKGQAMEDSPFATTAAGFNAIRGTLKPETSTTLEAGWRYRDGPLEGSVTAYRIDFKNRLLAIQQGSAIVGNPSVLANVGRVLTQGAEAGLAWQPVRFVKWFGSVSYNDSRYKENVVDNGSVVAVAGKQAVDSPRWIANSRLAYDNGSLFGHVGVNHLGQRYYTYLNDNGVGASTLWDLGLGYKRKAASQFIDHYQVQLNVTNLFNRAYIASIGTNGFVTSDPNGTAQTLLVGAPRTASVTFSAGF